MQFQGEMKNADRQAAKPLIFIRFLLIPFTLCGGEEVDTTLRGRKQSSLTF